MQLKKRSESGISCHTCPSAKHCLPKYLSKKEISYLDQWITYYQVRDANEFIYYIGHPSQYLFALKQGMVKDYKIDANVGTERINNFYLNGDILGLESLNTKKHAFSAQTLKESQLCLIPIEKIESHALLYPHLAKALMKTYCNALLNEKTFLPTTNAKQRVASFLLNLYMRLDERKLLCQTIYLPMTQADIANKLGLALETVNRVLHTFIKEKIIELHRSHELKILDLSKLKNRALYED